WSAPRSSTTWPAAPAGARAPPGAARFRPRRESPSPRRATTRAPGRRIWTCPCPEPSATGSSAQRGPRRSTRRAGRAQPDSERIGRQRLEARNALIAGQQLPGDREDAQRLGEVLLVQELGRQRQQRRPLARPPGRE